MALTWIKLAYLLISWGKQLFEAHRDEALKQVGEDRLALTQMQEMQAISSALKAVEEQHAGMSDAEIRAEIDRNKDFRD